MIEKYLKADAGGPIVITVADKSGRTIRTIRSTANKAGVNRAVWDLRYDPPTPAPGSGPAGGGFGRGGGGAQVAGGGQGRGGVAAQAAAAGAAPGGGPGAQTAQAAPGSTDQSSSEEIAARFGFGGGPSVVPGEYTITLTAGGKQLSKTVRVGLDPRLKVSDGDLNAQLDAALKLRDLNSTLNKLVASVDDLTKQLTTLAETMGKVPDAAATAALRAGDGDGTGPAAGNAGQTDNAMGDIKAALEELKKLRATLVREAPFGYRYPPRLREEVQSLMGSITSPIAPPTEPQMLRLRKVTDETQKAVVELNGIISGSIRRVNEKLSSQPHVVTGSPVK